MKFRKEYTYPLEFVHDILKGKWKAVILYQINFRQRVSPSQLERDISGISQKMLMQSLKDLLEYGFIDKIVSKDYPLHATYFLTNKGKRLIDALDIFQEIGKEYVFTPFSRMIIDEGKIKLKIKIKVLFCK